MPGLVPGIHAFLVAKTWMAGTSPAMTAESKNKNGAGMTPRRLTEDQSSLSICGSAAPNTGPA
jgi:hypothetical protein